MAATPSNMSPLGSPCPDFSLPDTVSGETVSRDDYKGRPLLVMFICNHCPFVKHIRSELALLGRDYGGKLGIVAISSNDIENYPDDAPDKMKIEAAEAGYAFPYLFDESQKVAHAFKAACTPDFFLYDADHKLAYRGQLDDSRPKSSEPVTGRDLRAAIKAVLEGRMPNEHQTPSMGCNIKWKKGNEPKD
ncbi:MAG: thioredoxin family protein [Phycisphaerales bacterium]|nr:MAG: thioredoxin family protein [Phycisphaerales bacterium]